jgi:hypothetical protein
MTRMSGRRAPQPAWAKLVAVAAVPAVVADAATLATTPAPVTAAGESPARAIGAPGLRPER